MREKLIKQGSYTFQCLLIVLLFAGFYSCEFESDDVNYVQKEKPKDEIQLGIDLAGVNPTELIYVYNNSSFLYSLYTDEKEIFVLQFFLDGEPIATNQDTGEAYINTNITDNEIHELVLLIALKTGSGSLAEYAKYEMYTGEFRFRIKIIPYSNNLNIRQTTDTNNNLKLIWDKPLHYEIEGYSVYIEDSMHGRLLAKINNPNETYFIDTEYAYGYKHYTIVAEVKNSYNLTVEDDIWARYEIMTEKDFEASRISANEFSVKWNNPNPFPCKYLIVNISNKEKKVFEDGLNETVISANDFPGWTDAFNLYILPKSADIELYDSYYPVFGSFRDKVFNPISFNGNLVSNILHGLNFLTLNNYDISTMKQLGYTNHNLTLDTGCKVQISKDGRVAISDSDGFIHIYSDYSLTNKITKLKIGNSPFQIISNDKLLIEKGNGFIIYDIITNKVITSKLWQSEITDVVISTKTIVSPNGKYIYTRCRKLFWDRPRPEWVELYEISEDNDLILLETISDTKIESLQFHPTKSNEVIIQYNPLVENMFEIIDIVTKKRKEIKGEFMNIDPFTGNILFRGEEYQNSEYNLYVWDNTYSHEKIKVKLAYINPWTDSRLINSNLFFNGYYVNLHNLKEWNQ